MITKSQCWSLMLPPTIRVPLSQGLFALINEADAPIVLPFKWSAYKCKKTFYASRWVGGTSVKMHRAILSAAPGKEVDHKNGDGLDNRRTNIRIATCSENHQNSNGRVHSSKYKGVRWSKQHGKWHARFRLNKKMLYLGSFNSEKKAAMIWNQMALRYHGDFARLNQVSG